MPSSFNTGLPNEAPEIGCQVVGDVCDRIKDSTTFPYKNDSQTAVFEGVAPQDGLMRLLGSYINLMGYNDTNMQFSTMDNANIWQATLPANGVFNGSGGPKVFEQPLNGVGDQRLRTGFKMYIPQESDKYRFFISQELIDGTYNGVPTVEIANNETRIVVPPIMGIFASNEAECGCEASCTGNGWREWFLMKKDGKNEKIWVRSTPPLGVTDTRDYGKLDATHGAYEGWYAMYMVRGVGVHAKPDETSFKPDSEGSPRTIELGDEIKIGSVVPVTRSGCLPSVSIRPTHYKRVTYGNSVQKMVDKIYSFTQEDVYRTTYHQEPQRINSEYKRELNATMTRFYNTLMFGQQNTFAQSDLDNDIMPGVGDAVQYNYEDNIPYGTDGFFTLLRKHARKVSFVIEDGCDNRCLLQEFKGLIEQISGSDYKSGNWVLLGTDYMFHMMQTMITNKVAPNSVSEAEKILFGGNRSLLTNEMFSINRESALQGINNNFMQYDRIKLGDREIPFIKDPELMSREPDVLYLINLDAIQFWHPNRELDERNGWMPSTAKAGTVMPNFVTNREMVNVNGQFQSYVPNNCPNSIWTYLQMGVWYQPDQLPQTFRIQLSGLMDVAGVPTPVSLDQIPCGCSNTSQTTYNALTGRA